MANYQEGQNAMSLDDRQNIIVAGVNSLNEALTKAKTNRLQKEALHRQLGRVTADTSGVDTIPGPGAEHDDPGDQAAARRAQRRQGPPAADADRQSSRSRQAQRRSSNRQPRGCAARPARSSSRSATTTATALAEEQNLTARSTNRSSRRSTSIARTSASASCSARPRAIATSTTRCSSRKKRCASSATAARTTCS